MSIESQQQTFLARVEKMKNGRLVKSYANAMFQRGQHPTDNTLMWMEVAIRRELYRRLKEFKFFHGV